MSFFRPTPAHLEAWNRDGYFLVPGLLTPRETERLAATARSDADLARQAASRLDASGAVTKLAVSNDLGDDLYSAIVRSERIVRTMEAVLGDEVYHYHHKMNMKEPFEGGAWEWHQDYGYWYNNGCLFPSMASCFIAVDQSTRENGCLQVIKGSHHMGRVDHGKTGDQTGADMERVEQALKRMELVYVEMQPGDGLFFHGNLLHRSDQNRSPKPRWVFICCYNTKSNDPYKPGRHPNYTPLNVLPDEMVAQMGNH
jgi:hypothetical protein